MRLSPCNSASWPPLTALKRSVAPRTAMAPACSDEPLIARLIGSRKTTASIQPKKPVAQHTRRKMMMVRAASCGSLWP